MPDTESLNKALRRALEAGDFESAEWLGDELGELMTEDLKQAQPAERAALFELGLSRLQEHLSLARVLRAHVASQLQTCTTVCAYQEDPDEQPSWHCKG